MTTTISPSRMADFDLTSEQQAVRRAVREFAEREILPHVESHEREHRYPEGLIKKLIPLGYLTPVIPEQYGGVEGAVLLGAKDFLTVQDQHRLICAVNDQQFRNRA